MRILILAFIILLNVACQSNGKYINKSAQEQAATGQVLVEDLTKNRQAKNLLNQAIEPCCFSPKTGYFRDGYCHFDEDDYGVHLICAVMTDEYLNYSKSQGNDLITPIPERRFPGLKAGDKWCLCVSRWEEAYRVGVAPKIDIHSTHHRVSEMLSMDLLISQAIE